MVVPRMAQEIYAAANEPLRHGVYCGNGLAPVAHAVYLHDAASVDRAASRSPTLLRRRRGRTSDRPPPRAEFLLSTAGFDVLGQTGGAGDPRARRAARARRVRRPLLRALHRRRRSLLRRALLVGERLYRRDLITGDSAVVFADTTVPRIAAAYAQAHPDERPLDPDEEGEAESRDFGDRRGRRARRLRSVPVVRVSRRRRGAGHDRRGTRRGAACSIFAPADQLSSATCSATRSRCAIDEHGSAKLRAAARLRRADAPDAERNGPARAPTRSRGSHFDERSFTLSNAGGEPGRDIRRSGSRRGRPKGTSSSSIPSRRRQCPGGVDWSAGCDGPTTPTTIGGTDPAIGLLARYDTSGESRTCRIADRRAGSGRRLGALAVAPDRLARSSAISDTSEQRWRARSMQRRIMMRIPRRVQPFRPGSRTSIRFASDHRQKRDDRYH